MKKSITLFATVLLVVATLATVWALGNTYKIEPTGVLQEDLVLNLYDNQVNDESHCFNSAALATTATTAVSIAAAVNYTKNGVFGQIATGTIALTGATQEVSTTKLYCFSYDTASSTTEITIGAADETDINKIAQPAGNILFGYLKIVTDSTHEFVPGTTGIAAAGITGTYYNMAFKPSRCRVSNTSR